MLKIGLTGGIGAGKSAVARRLAELGAVVIDADRLAREVVEPGTEGFDEVLAAFGRDVVGADGRLDRPALAAVVFGAPDARRRLESIIHPRVGARTRELLEQAAEDAIVVHDVPLLVEAGLAATYHLVVVVEAPRRVRVDRLVADRGMTVEQARERIAAQASPEQRRAAADVLLDNAGTLDALHHQVDALWKRRLLGYEENLRRHRPVRRPERLDLVAYDPAWPDQYVRLAARIALAVGERAVRIDHVGSTAVPGIVAKDVVDIQLSVADLEVADELAPALDQAGFPRFPGEWTDSPKPLHPDPADWRKRLHGGADPDRLVHLHVRAAGSPGARYALLFRDWLRAVPEEAAAYRAEKQRLASTGIDATGYAEAKEPWFDAAVPRAEKWAERTGWRP